MTIEELVDLVQSRKETGGPESGTAKLMEQGVHAIGKKLVEEAAESWMAARFETKEQLAEELSQVLYYVVCMMVAREIPLSEVYKKL